MRFWPYFNFVDFRAYFGNFSLVNGVEHKNLSLNFNFWSITLKLFFVNSYNPRALVVKRTKLNSKKSEKWDSLVFIPHICISLPAMLFQEISEEFKLQVAHDHQLKLYDRRGTLS